MYRREHDIKKNITFRRNVFFDNITAHAVWTKSYNAPKRFGFPRIRCDCKSANRFASHSNGYYKSAVSGYEDSTFSRVRCAQGGPMRPARDESARHDQRRVAIRGAPFPNGVRDITGILFVEQQQNDFCFFLQCYIITIVIIILCSPTPRPATRRR